MKQAYVWLILLSTILLCACSPAQVPEDLTAPPTAPPATENPREEALTGVGTICDIVKYQDGFLMLTHTGLYTLDKNLENRQRLEGNWNKPFEEFERDSFFERLSFATDQDEGLLKGLAVADGKICFACNATESIYLNGEAKEVGLSWMSSMFTYDGKIYSVWKGNSESDKQLWKITANAECYDCAGLITPVRVNGTEYLVGQPTEGIEGQWLDCFWTNVSQFDSYDSFFYYLEYDTARRDYEDETGAQTSELLILYDFKRFNGESVEDLVCDALEESGKYVRRIIILDDSHVLFLTDSGHLEIAEFSVKQN